MSDIENRKRSNLAEQKEVRDRTIVLPRIDLCGIRRYHLGAPTLSGFIKGLMQAPGKSSAWNSIHASTTLGQTFDSKRYRPNYKTIFANTIPMTTEEIVATSPGRMKLWFSTYLPILVVPV